MTHAFTVILAGEDVLTPEICDRLFEAGINGDDAEMSSSGGSLFVDFDREAASLADAVASAIRDVECAGYRVRRIEIGP